MTSPLGSSPSGKPEPAGNSSLPLQRGQRRPTKHNNQAGVQLSCSRAVLRSHPCSGSACDWRRRVRGHTPPNLSFVGATLRLTVALKKAPPGAGERLELRAPLVSTPLAVRAHNVYNVYNVYHVMSSVRRTACFECLVSARRDRRQGISGLPGDGHAAAPSSVGTP